MYDGGHEGVVDSEDRLRGTDRMEPNLLESSLKYVNGDGFCVPPHKERCVGAPRASTTAVFGKHLSRLGSDRHEPSFEELRISDGKNAAGKIDIAYRQRE